MTGSDSARDFVRRFTAARSMEQPPLDITAHHEAGHVAGMLHCGVEVRTATIEPRESSWGEVAPTAEALPLDTQLFYLFCGEYAEAQYTGDHLATSLRQSQVDGDRQIINSIAEVIEQRSGSTARRERLIAAEDAAYEFTKSNAEVIKALADLLLDKRTISGTEAEIVYKTFKERF